LYQLAAFAFNVDELEGVRVYEDFVTDLKVG
jgi:hypothetical protein